MFVPSFGFVDLNFFIIFSAFVVFFFVFVSSSLVLFTGTSHSVVPVSEKNFYFHARIPQS